MFQYSYSFIGVGLETVQEIVLETAQEIVQEIVQEIALETVLEIVQEIELETVQEIAYGIDPAIENDVSIVVLEAEIGVITDIVAEIIVAESIEKVDTIEADPEAEAETDILDEEGAGVEIGTLEEEVEAEKD